MATLTDREWNRVQEALVRGGLRETIEDIVSSRSPEVPQVMLSDWNRRIIERAYDDGDGNIINLVPTDDPPWFAGMWEDQEVMLGMEHNGTLYSVVHASGGGLVSVIVGRGLIENEMGIAFHGVEIAKAYVKGLTAER